MESIKLKREPIPDELKMAAYCCIAAVRLALPQ